jgi:hypothetical protein
VQDRYRGGGGGGNRQGGGGGGNRYGGGGRRRRGRGGRPHEIYPDVALEPEEHIPWAEEFEREPNPDAEPLHLAYDSVYTHEGDVREELLEAWVEASTSGKRWRCWNCGRNTQRFTQLRLPTLRTVISICDNCGTWTVWDAWRDLANPRIFSFRRTIEETEPAATREPDAAAAPVSPAVGSNGSGRLAAASGAVASASPPASTSDAPASAATQAELRPAAGEPAAPAPRAETPTLPGFGASEPAGPVTPEPSLQPAAEASPTEAEASAATKPKRTRAPRAKTAEPAAEGEAPKPRATRSRAKAAATPAAAEAPAAE